MVPLYRRMANFSCRRRMKRKSLVTVLLLGCVIGTVFWLYRGLALLSPEREVDRVRWLPELNSDGTEPDTQRLGVNEQSLHHQRLRDRLARLIASSSNADQMTVSRDRSPDRKLYHVPQMKAYCNSPLIPITGSEGTAPEGFTLRQTHVFIRHGDRTSMHHFQGYQTEQFNCSFEKWYNGSNEKFLNFPKVIQKFTGKQHKRSHFLNWALLPKKDVCGDSDLTSIGTLQHLNLGQMFYQKYIQQSQLFDSQLALTSQMYVRSTGFSRTYQSAVALLYGMLPKFDNSALNIDNSPSLLFCSTKYTLSCDCPYGRKLSYRAGKYKSSFQSNDTEFVRLRKEISDVFEVRLEDVPSIHILMDTFSPPICHNYVQPCSIKNRNKCVNDAWISGMWSVMNKVELERMRDPNRNFEKNACIMMHPVLVEIAHRIKDITEGRQTQRFVLYSGHDITITPLLVVFDLFDGVWPPYASRFVIELYECDGSACPDTGHRHFLRFLYNGVDRTESVVFCRGKTTSGLCDVKHFNDYVYKIMLRQFGYTSFTDACRRRHL